MKKTIRIIGGLALGLVAMGFLGRFFDAQNLPVFHTWGLAHGSFIIVWPVFAVLFYFALGWVPFLKKKPIHPQQLDPTLFQEIARQKLTTSSQSRGSKKGSGLDSRHF